MEKKGGPYRKRSQLAVEMLQVLCEAHENRCFHVVADSAYGGKTVYLNLPKNCDLTSRLDLDARLHEAPPVRQPGAIPLGFILPLVPKWEFVY